MLWFALFSVSFRSKKLNIFSVLLFVHLELVSIWLAIASRLLFVAISFQVHCCSFPSYSYQQSAHTAFFLLHRLLVSSTCLYIVQVLKLMYHAPVTSSYHQSTWAKIGRIVNPYIHRYCPFLQTPISAIQRWWFRQWDRQGNYIGC